ncbi:amino acid adenylation domain-containing protein [Pseudomonas poae]|uniref:Amino acid adenylation domain-containing protein n=2 Tax=Pseudomonas fluorescens group TaxID=136843 RepID=A0A7M1KM92_9PSED|nr:amino acid adenylation domain-containing protein [Pseudomonas poae]QOQ77407.1 amino acid adenylation domain-containing protein [Pseudomonas poae]
MQASLRQKVLCLQQSIDPSQPGMLLEVAFHVITHLSTSQLVSRIERVVERHASLRQRFVMRNGTYWIEQAPPQQRRYCVVRTYDEASTDALLAPSREHIGVESERLFRAEVVERSDGQRYLVFRIHHIIADLWSVGLLIRDFAEDCMDRSSITLASRPIAPLIDPEFWRHQMSQDTPFSLPMASLEQHTDRRMVLSSFVIDQESSADLARLATACAVTPYTVMLAAQVLALSRIGQSGRLSLAVTFHGRNRGNKDAVGYFANTLAVPFDVSECSVGEFVKRTAKRLDEASKASVGAGYPELAEFMTPLGWAATAPTNAVIYQQDMPGMPRGLAAALLGLGTVQLGEMALTAEQAPPSIGPFATALLLTRHDGKLHGRVEVDPAQHPGWLAEALARQFAVILREMVRDPQARLSALPACLLHQPKYPSQARPAPASETLVATFLRQVAITPDKPALRTPQASISYSELASRVARLSAALRVRGFKPEQTLAILLPRDINLVPALLAIMACGGSYVPLSDANPAELNRSILTRARCRAILTDQEGLTRFAHLAPCWSLSDLLSMPDAPLQDQSKLQAKAYILFTSGSTGEPKGVAITHANAANLLRWAALDCGPEYLAQTLAATPTTFDLSIFEMFAPLMVGGCVQPVSSVMALIDNPALLKGTTLINTVPSVADALLQHDVLVPSLRMLNLAGEPLNRDLYLRLQAKLTATRIVNLYGPTETTTYSTALVIEPAQQEITIGFPLYGTWVDVVDQNMQSVGIGVPGELIIHGHGVAQGYVSDPVRSAASFLPASDGLRCYRTGDRVRWLPDGRLDFIGREDDQVKVRGFRVELGPVQAALHAIETIHESAVVVVPKGQQRSIVAFIVLKAPSEDEAVQRNNIKQHLLGVLPYYALPDKFIFVKALPRNTHGKIDRTLLLQHEPQTEQESAMRDATDVEHRIANCWQTIIGHPVQLHENFLDIGGHSLSLTHLTGLLRKEFNIHISLHDLWIRPTIEQQADFIHKLQNSVLTKPAAAPIPRLDRKISHH